MRRGSAASHTAAFENTQTKGHTKNEHDEKREVRQMCRAVEEGGAGMIVRNFDKYSCEPANDHSGICYMAGIYGDGGRGMYATADHKELAWLQEAVEQYDATKRASLKLEAEVKRLKKANAELRKQLPAKRPNRKAVAV